MLDIKFIRENVDRVKESTKNKNKNVDIDKLLQLDEQRRKIMTELDELRAEQNKASAEIAKASDTDRQVMIEQVGELKDKVQKLERELAPVAEEFEALLYQVPNVTDPDMPAGKSEDENVVIKQVGEKPSFNFEPKEHWELGKELDLIDTEKAAEVSGARFWYLKGDLVRLQFAMHMFAIDTLINEDIIKDVRDSLGLEHLSSKPFVPMLPPVMVRNDVQYAIHRVFGDQTYKIESEDLNLVASAEHTLAPYHMNETLDESELPKRYIGYSTAFRREAGTYGKDMKGILRGHQFDKSEMESFTTQETGADEQRLIVGLQEYMVGSLGLPYQVVQICTGDAGGPDYQQIDIECWMPGQGAYRETNTSDYMTDYQTRGINAYYKTKDGERKLLYANDATAFSGRPLIAIMENYQQEDGSIKIPEVLQKYMGGQSTIK
jgi:seryl-tRNA synthetase